MRAGMRIRIRDWHIRQWILAGALASLALVGPPCSWGQPQLMDEQVKFAANAEKIKGHLLSSRELYARGEAAYAAIHAAHPVQELWSLLRDPLTQASPEFAKRVGALLEKPGQEIDAKVSTKRYEDTVRGVFAALDEAVSRVVPSEIHRSVVFQARVVLAILEDVAEEYEEGFKEGKITQVVEYQDAYGFFRRTQTLYRSIAGPLRKKAPEAANEIEKSLAALSKGFAGVMPPATPLPAEQIKKEVLRVSTELSKVSGF